MRRALTFGLSYDNLILFYSQLMMSLGLGLQVMLWPLYIASLGATPVQIGVVIGGAAILRTVLVIPAGSLSDRISTRTMILATTAMLVPGGAIIALAQTWWQALFGALLLEISGVGIPAISSHIAGTADAGRRTHAYSMVFTVAAGVGVLVGPPIGGFIADLTTLRVVFFVVVALYAGSVGLAFLLRDVKPDGQVEPEDGATAADDGRGYLQIVRQPAIVSIATLHALVPLALSTGVALLSLFLEEVRGVSVSQLGVLGAISASGGILLGLVAGRNRYLSRPFIGMAVTVLLTLTGLVLLRSSGTLAVIGVAYFLRGTYNVVWSMLASALSEVTPENNRGRAFGLAEFGAGIGDTSAPVLAGWLYATRETLPLEVAILGCIPLLGAIALSAWLAGRVSVRPGSQRSPERQPSGTDA